MKTVKQVILVRTDISMPPGKAFSQVAHASMKFLANKIRDTSGDGSVPSSVSINLNDAERDWLEGKFTKIVLGVSSEAELSRIADQCKEMGITTGLIVDDGTTVFAGVPTATCLAVGPDYSERIDLITGHLKLFC